MAARILERLRKAADAWPVVEARAGRDLGEYIKGSYAARVTKLAETGPSGLAEATTEVQAAESLLRNEIREKYRRASDTTFTGELASKYTDKLSTSAQQGFNKQSFLDRLFGKKLPCLLITAVGVHGSCCYWSLLFSEISRAPIMTSDCINALQTHKPLYGC